jgi:hypothetical protein
MALAAVATPYRRWCDHFQANHPRPRELPWDDPYRLSRAELRAVAPSIRLFQLGEWARGRGLMRRAEADTRVAATPGFLDALRLFVAEEQRHSAMLGRFLDIEGVAWLEAHWVDRVFRGLRKLAGLEACLAVLVTAEILAMPFYQALRDATRSPLLRAICRRILCDEASHLDFQASALALLRRPLTEWSRRWRGAMHAALYRATALAVWSGHRAVFHAAGWSFARYWREAERGFGRFEAAVARGAPPEPAFRLED